MGKDRAVGRQLRTLIELGAVAELSDGQLLERFASSRGEAAELAFAEIVERHGPMVLRVCRSVLDDPHDSDDAFQATFLVLVARGRELWVRDSLGPWLHQVAHRTARCARSNAARRKRLELRASLVRGNVEKQTQPESSGEPERALLEEIDRLPERYRAPVVLCDLEGRTHEAAARALGWPIGTVKSRQARARDRLRDRLRRRGFAPASGLALLDLPRSIPTVLVNSTTRLAVRSVASGALARGSAAWIAQEVLRSMSILRSLKFASLVLAVGAAGSGAGLIARGSGTGRQEPKAQIQADAKPQEKPQAAAAPLDKSVYEIKPGKLQVTSSYAGNVEAAATMDIISQVEGTTTIITIKPEGSVVSKGELVAELDSATLRDTLVNQRIAVQMGETAYNQAKLVREASEYAVKEYLEGVLPAEQARLKEKIATAEAGLKEGEAQIERTRAARKKLDDMFAATKGPTTPSDIVADVTLNALLESAGRSLADHKRDLAMARKDQEVLEKFTREKTTRKLQFDLEEAKGSELNKFGRWNAEKAKEKKIERQIERCQLVAPGDGYLLYANAPAPAQGRNRVQIEEGASVRERQIICRVIGPNTPMRLNVKIAESMIDKIRPGQKATIYVNAFNDKTLTGTVRNVAPLADANALFDNNQKVYTTYIKIDQIEPGLRPGLSARANIVFEELDQVLRVSPRSIVFLHEGDLEATKTADGKIEWKPVTKAKHQVAVRTPGGEIEWRDVTYGLSNGTIIEIKSGLKAGDIVLLDPANDPEAAKSLSEEVRRRKLQNSSTGPPPGRPEGAAMKGLRSRVCRGVEDAPRICQDSPT